MTLVACLTSINSPILLGDLLVSDRRQTEDLSYARKKIRRLGSTVAIGWAGNQVGADTVVAELEQKLNEGADKQDVENALLAIGPRDSPGVLNLVGWVVDGEADAFLWQSSCPDMVHWGGPWYIGSGSDLMNHLLPKGIETLPGDEDRDPRLSALEVATHLMADETLYGKYTEFKIGGAYEVMWWNGTAFEYIEPVHYFAAQYTYDANGNVLNFGMLGRHFKYFTRDELTVVIRYEGELREGYICTPIGQPVPGKTDRAACRALIEELKDSKGWLLGPDTEFYGILFDLEAPGYKRKGPVSALPRGFKNSGIEVIESETTIELDLSSDAVRRMFETMEKA